MRITFVLPAVNLSGGIRVVAIYAKALQEMGYKVGLVSVLSQTLSFSKRAKQFIKTLKLPTKPVSDSHLDGLLLNHRVIESNRPIVDGDLPDADVVIATCWEIAEWVNAQGSSKEKKSTSYNAMKFSTSCQWSDAEQRTRCHCTRSQSQDSWQIQYTMSMEIPMSTLCQTVLITLSFMLHRGLSSSCLRSDFCSALHPSKVSR